MVVGKCFLLRRNDLDGGLCVSMRGGVERYGLVVGVGLDLGWLK